ncbi:MAG TPA: hypothetical protein VGL08_01305 [Paraburkholderia sp.]
MKMSRVVRALCMLVALGAVALSTSACSDMSGGSDSSSNGGSSGGFSSSGGSSGGY